MITSSKCIQEPQPFLLTLQTLRYSLWGALNPTITLMNNFSFPKTPREWTDGS